MTSPLGMAQLTKVGKTVFVDGVPARDVPIFPDENCLLVPMPLVDTMMTGLLMGSTWMIYGFTTEAAQEAYVEKVIRAKRMYHSFEPQVRFSFGGNEDGPFEKFWKKAPKDLVIAIRFVAVQDAEQYKKKPTRIGPDGSRTEHLPPKVTEADLNEIYVDMMGVRPSWRGGKLMLGMLKRLVDQFPGKALSFSPPTEAGLATIYAAQAAGLPVVMPKKMDGGGPIEPPGFKKKSLQLRVRE